MDAKRTRDETWGGRLLYQISVKESNTMHQHANYYLPLVTYLVTRRISDDDILVLGPILLIMLFHSVAV